MYTGPAAPIIMSKAAIQQRLMAATLRPGRSSPKDPRLLLRDIAGFTGVTLLTLTNMAHRRREVDDALQLQLSVFFTLIDAGTLVKQLSLDGKTRVLKRILPAAGAPAPPRATIDLRGPQPRVIWG